MKPAIFTSFDYDTPFEKSVDMIIKSGFESIGLGASRHSGYDTSDGRKKIKKLLKAGGLRVDSIHAPFPEGDCLFDLDEQRRRGSLIQCKHAIDASACLRAGVVAVHLMPLSHYIEGDSYPNIVLTAQRDPYVEQRMISQGMRSISELVEYADKNGVMLGLENGQVEDYDIVLEMFLKEFQGPVVGLCYDSGHENVKGGCFKMLEKHAGRLNSLHIHDNRGTDAHMLPYEGTIDWRKFNSLLQSLDYAGDLCLEVHPLQSGFKDLKVFLFEARKRADCVLALNQPE